MSNSRIFEQINATLKTRGLSDRQFSSSLGLKHDPNIWVCTPEVARRAGMPVSWASDALQGVAAAAFHLTRERLEENENGVDNPKNCKPELCGVLELYFDRQQQPLPWNKRMRAADFDCQDAAVERDPFAEPQTGDALRFVSGHNDLHESGRVAYKVIAYDREIHARYAFVRLCQNRFDFDAICADGLTLELGSETQIFHHVFLPGVWTQRLIALGQQFKI